MKDYRIVHSDKFQSLEIQVKKLQKEGWETTGGINHTPHKLTTQAMTLSVCDHCFGQGYFKHSYQGETNQSTCGFCHGTGKHERNID